MTTLCPEDHRPCDGSCGVAETGECGRERTAGEYAARAVAREKARIEGVPAKQIDRHVEDNWFGEWVLVTNSLRTWRQERRR